MADYCCDIHLPDTGDASQETMEQPSVGPELQPHFEWLFSGSPCDVAYFRNKSCHQYFVLDKWTGIRTQASSNVWSIIR